MDDSHSEARGGEMLTHDSDNPHFQPSAGGEDVEASKELREEQTQEMLDEKLTPDQEQNETSTGENEEDMEEDETEGLPKALKKGYKAVKRFFKGSDNQKKAGDPESTFQHVSPPPAVSPERIDADDDVYDFTHKKRGRAVIINNEKFDSYSKFQSRPGSKFDENSLKDLFKQLGFDVKCYNDLTAVDIKFALENEARQYDHGSADCLAVAILSHGDSEVFEKAKSYYQQKAHQHDDKVMCDLIFGVDGNHITTASIIRTFQDDRCPGLLGKPRLFFLQACRGDSFDDGVKVHVVRSGDAADHSRHDDKDYAGEIEETDAQGRSAHRKRHVISPAPIFKDFLVMYATTPGHFAWRRSSGTWFIQSLHKVLMQQLTCHLSLTQALTRVCRMVAHGYQSQGTQTGKKQTPVIESMLTKDVYFTARK